MADAPGGRIEYAIRRLNWRRAHYGLVRMPGATAVGARPTFEEADADRAEREAEVRARVGNPFLCGPTHAVRSRLPEPIFCDWLRDAGLDPPAELPADWAKWWAGVRDRPSAAQVAHLWAGLDRVRFFEVVARPAGSVGYVVVRVQWEYNDQWMEPGAEGGEPMKVFRARAAAEAYRREREDAERAERAEPPDDEDAMRYETTRWADEADWPLGTRPGGRWRYEDAMFARAEAAPFYEVVEVELPPAGERS